MASSLERLRTLLSEPVKEEELFGALQSIAALFTDPDPDSVRVAREMCIRLLERRDDFAAYAPIVNDLIREAGLFPYLASEELNLRESVAYEVHRPQGLDAVFHRVQASVYRDLIDGENVILSAPTSFGKSLVFDAIVASGLHTNLALIVPTLALIDEARRRLSRFSDYKVITHASQSPSDRNIYVLTQERFLAFEKVPAIAFFMVDEFYKLGDSSERASLLNLAVYRLMKLDAQFYMAGPNIRSLSEVLPINVRATFRATDFETVAVDVVQVRNSNDKERKDKLLALLKEVDGPSIIYCQSPKRVREVASWLLETMRQEQVGMIDTADWLDMNFGSNWTTADALREGIGVHHGQLPRWLSQEVIRGFNAGELKTLICTNTIIEGVNTRAKNVFILDKNIATKAYDYFTFANIRGRGGRMFQHFVGRAFLFHTPPNEEYPSIDFPAISQSEEVPDDVLLSLDPRDLTPASRKRVVDMEALRHVSRETLQANVGIDIDSQVALARHLTDYSHARFSGLLWQTAYPKYDQVKEVVDLIWDLLPPAFHRSKGPRTSSQLTFFLFEMSKSEGDIRSVISKLEESGNEPIDESIERAITFTRFWMEHNLPSRLRALERIVNDSARAQSSRASYAAYAARVEALFDRPFLMSLEEFGVPMQVARKLRRWIPASSGLDDLLHAFSDLPEKALQSLTAYERVLVRQAAASFPAATADNH